jgi:beta-phosphoglucomutase-like phosphatase (HAD superfamily)
MAVLRFALDEPFAALIFDCDGTLVDTARAHLAAYNVLENLIGVRSRQINA